MRRIIQACGLLLAMAASLVSGADVSVTPGPSDLFKGSAKLSTHSRVEQCIDAAIHAGDGAYACLTASTVAVQAGTPNVCGAGDIGGWTVPVPTPLDTTVLAATDKAQPGSRLYYISAATGNDATGVVYFWDGTQVVDAAGATYGTDPMNPVGVKPFKRWSWVAPRRATNTDIGTTGYFGDAWPGFRGGYPDWWLFRRGETYDIKADVESFDAEKQQVGTNKYAGLTIPGGRSATERQIMGAYGDLCAARPRFVHPLSGFANRGARSGMFDFKHAMYQSLHFDAHDRPAGTHIGISWNTMTEASVDIVMEDVWIDGSGLGIGDDNAGQFLLRRVLITDSFMEHNESHAQGLYYEGARVGWLRVEDSILMRNGFTNGDPSKTPWPPTGTQIWDLYSRNQYINGMYDSSKSGLFDSVSMIGASGDQWRGGGRIQRNFLYNGYFNVGARGGYPDEEGYSGQVLNNVLQRFVGTGTDDNRGQPGWGFDVSAGSAFVYVAGNIVTGAQHPSKYWGLKFSPIQQDCYAQPVHPTRNNKAVANIVDSGSASAGLQVLDGTTTDCFVDTIPVPGVVGNKMADNVVVNDKSVEHEYVATGKAPPTTDTQFSGNRVFASRAEAAAALGWPDPNRTLKTYMKARGVDVKSVDGFPEYFARATKLQRGKWDPQWTARPMVDYVREGFGMGPIGAQLADPTRSKTR